MSTIATLPAIPSKYDVVPLHQSDISTFKRCKRRWDWSSPMRQNLTGKVSQLGIVEPLWFGTGIHYCLQQYYDPRFQRDPVETFVRWFDLVMRGGIVREDEVHLSYDASPKQKVGEEDQTVYEVEGLYDLLADPDAIDWEAHKDLGINMMKFYREYAPKNDNFRVIAAEHTFSVPLLDPTTGVVIMAVDPRDGERKEVHSRGTQDAIIQDITNGMYGILEHKTSVDISEGYFDKLDKDEQCTRYMWAGEREAEMYDLPFRKISFVLYNGIRKAYPKPPSVLKSGMFSIDRSKESTTYEMLQQFIRQNGIQVIVDVDPKLSAYVDYVKGKGDSQFVERRLVTRNRQEIVSCGERIYMEALDMLAPDLRIYPNPTGDWSCLKCFLRGPCIARDDGSDWEQMLRDNYEVNRGR